MTSIAYDSMAAWSNYHLTIGQTTASNPIPSMTIESLGRVYASDLNGLPGLQRFAATGTILLKHLALLGRSLNGSTSINAQPFAAGMTGRGWSFSPLIGAPVSQLQCDGLSGSGKLDKHQWNKRCAVPAHKIALTSGGTRLRELVQWAERIDLTIETSGTHLGPTIAGGAATASHGSRLGSGGLQNLVLGMHLIVGEKEHVWIQRKSCPVLSKAGLDALNICGATLQVVSDDQMFEDALVHLGGMGIVNGLAIALVPNDTFALMRRREKLTEQWLKDVACGRFNKIARRLNCRAKPEFYEITINPHAPFDDDATHMMYFKRTVATLLPPGDADILRPSDAIAQLGAWLAHYVSTLPKAQGYLDDIEQPFEDPDPTVVQTLKMLLKGHDSVFSFYRGEGGFEPNTGIFDPNDPDIKGYHWSGLHHDEITGNTPGALYNASYAIPLECVPAAISVICQAVADIEPSFVFSLRFLKNAAGTLAFTRFTDCAVIEIDGLSPLICKLTAGRLPGNTPDIELIRQTLETLSKTLPAGALRVRKALETAGIKYSMHWAKLGGPDKDKVYADFGDPAEPDSLIRQWRSTRAALLSSLGKKLFWNEHLMETGILDAASIEADPC